MEIMKKLISLAFLMCEMFNNTFADHFNIVKDFLDNKKCENGVVFKDRLSPIQKVVWHYTATQTYPETLSAYYSACDYTMDY